MKYYIDKLLNQITLAIRDNNGCITIEEISAKVPCPPILKSSSLRIFVKKYPDRIQMHTDTTTNIIWIQEKKKSKGIISGGLPSFGGYKVIPSPALVLTKTVNAVDDIDSSILSGNKEKKLNSVETKLDDMKTKLDYELPRKRFVLQILSAHGLILNNRGMTTDSLDIGCFDPFAIYAVVYFNGLEIGRTPCKMNSTCLIWHKAVFEVFLEPNSSINDPVNWMYVEVRQYNFKKLDNDNDGKNVNNVHQDGHNNNDKDDNNNDNSIQSKDEKQNNGNNSKNDKHVDVNSDINKEINSSTEISKKNLIIDYENENNDSIIGILDIRGPDLSSLFGQLNSKEIQEIHLKSGVRNKGTLLLIIIDIPLY
jgi:hypothetical protein